MKKTQTIPDYYIFVCDYEWTEKDAAQTHAKRFEDRICKWNKNISKYEVFKPSYSKI